LPDDGSAVALSWALIGNEGCAAQLVARPFFSGCGPRSFRDVGFQFETEANGGRLTWLPNVRGQESLQILMANIAMNRFGRPIAFVTKWQLRLRRKT
jgi:hypothetical protein